MGIDYQRQRITTDQQVHTYFRDLGWPGEHRAEEVSELGLNRCSRKCLAAYQ